MKSPIFGFPAGRGFLKFTDVSGWYQTPPGRWVCRDADLPDNFIRGCRQPECPEATVLFGVRACIRRKAAKLLPCGLKFKNLVNFAEIFVVYGFFVLRNRGKSAEMKNMSFWGLQFPKRPAIISLVLAAVVHR